MRSRFRAPWSWKTRIITAAAVAIGAVLYVTEGTAGLVGLLLVGALVFSVRGYSIERDRVVIHRMGWGSAFPLDELEGAWAAPHATMGSMRLAGVGGVFGFLGRYRNSTLGVYRSFATDHHRTVVLDFEGERVVVTPDDPEEFLRSVRAAAHLPPDDPGE
jgi:hypothetical protein